MTRLRPTRRTAIALLITLALGGVLSALFVVFFVLPGLIVPPDLVTAPKDRLQLQNAVRTTAAQTLGGLLVLGGLLLTARSIHVNREGQITERFSRAIEHLGSDKLDIRLGGIYALERIARNSRADHATVMQVLTAYVREHTPWPPPGVSDLSTVPERERRLSEIS